MKCIPAVSSFAVLALAACDTMTAPLTSSGDFDPLRPPGESSVSVSSTGDNNFSPGQFVRAAMDNTAFFNKRPDGNADADKLLKQDTSMKVVSNTGSYVKVELDSGEVGFVPSVMVVDPNASTALAGSPNEVQVYPPISGVGPVEPLPAFDAPPEGTIPTIIDPEAPAPLLPAATPPAETFPVPSEPAPTEPAPATGAPLPPNGEE